MKKVFKTVEGAAQLVRSVRRKIGGIVHATGPDPFGNCMPLPRLSRGALCELPLISFEVKDNYGKGFGE